MNVVKNLGRVLVGTKTNLKIGIKEPVPQNYKIEKSCNCFKATFDRKKQELTVSMTASPVPKHLLQKGKFEYIVSKTIKIVSPSNPNFKPVKVVINMTVYMSIN